MLIRIDAFAITLLETFSHWTQEWFGWTSITWNRLFAVLALADLVCREIPELWRRGDRAWPVILVITVAAELLTALLREPTGGLNECPTMNPRKFEYSFWRPLCLVLACVGMPFDLMRGASLWFELLTLARYFGVCDDFPPGPSKLKEFLRRFRRPQQPEPVPA